MQILKLELLTNSIERSQQFYGDVLSLPVTHKDEVSISFKAGASQLTFILSETSNPFYHFAFNIPCNQLDEALAWTESRVDILPLSPQSKVADYGNWNAKAFYFLDFSGNIVELIARYDLNNQSSNSFNHDSILAISEIGMVTEDVDVVCKQFQREYSLSIFTKQPPAKNFAAIGDDNGLFIVVTEDKKWFPTDTPVSAFPVRATITNNQNMFELVWETQ
ncbi:MAG: hypothetical protein JWQ96_1892 [Segetibacter sp.]|jgi:catechol-2,3-dioxygenase|nr:hypothetical protein [Segetibacter sp.]